MAVKIRLKRMGSRKRPFFRMVAADSRFPRDGRIIETLGYYNPMAEPPEIQLDDDKVFKWLNRGARLTDNTTNLLKKTGLLERWQLLNRGVAIAELDAAIEERRMKQPKRVPKQAKKLSKKAAARAKAEAEKEAAGTEAAKSPDTGADA